MAAKTAASKDVTGAAHTETTNDKEQTDDDDDAPTPKHWSSDWDPTLNSLLSVYVQCTAFSLYVIYYTVSQKTFTVLFFSLLCVVVCET